MWYLLTIILAIIGSIVAWAGEPMGAILFVPLAVVDAWHEFKGTTK